MRVLNYFLVVSIGLLLSACSLGPDYTRPEVTLPEHYVEPPVSGDSFANLPWWEVFKDEKLRELIRVALAENKDLLVAAARIDQARALLGFTRADQFPRLDGSGNGSRIEPGKESFVSVAEEFNDFGLFGALAFELDIWGKLRRATEAQRAELLATEYIRSAVTISLVSQVASTYFLLLDLDNRLSLSKVTLKNRGNATAIIQARFDKGVVAELDLNQAQIEESDAAVTVASLQRDLRQGENALSILLGKPPSIIVRGAGLEKQLLSTEVPAGFPASLLERRPDVIAAEERLKAEVARIGVAKAQRLPSLNLLGFVGLQSEETSELLTRDAFTWSIGGDFLGPLIDFGKGRSRVAGAEARAEEARHGYEQTVIQAVREVEDAAVAIRTFAEEYKSRTAQAKAARNAAKLSRARYDEGVTSYLEVLDIERSLFDAELSASIARQRHLSSVVQLYKALGGGWSKVPKTRL